MPRHDSKAGEVVEDALNKIFVHHCGSLDKQMPGDTFVLLCQDLLFGATLDKQVLLGIFHKHKGSREVRMNRGQFRKAFMESVSLSGLNITDVLNRGLSTTKSRSPMVRRLLTVGAHVSTIPLTAPPASYLLSNGAIPPGERSATTLQSSILSSRILIPTRLSSGPRPQTANSAVHGGYKNLIRPSTTFVQSEDYWYEMLSPPPQRPVSPKKTSGPASFTTSPYSFIGPLPTAGRKKIEDADEQFERMVTRMEAMTALRAEQREKEKKYGNDVLLKMIKKLNKKITDLEARQTQKEQEFQATLAELATQQTSEACQDADAVTNNDRMPSKALEEQHSFPEALLAVKMKALETLVNEGMETLRNQVQNQEAMFKHVSDTFKDMLQSTVKGLEESIMQQGLRLKSIESQQQRFTSELASTTTATSAALYDINTNISQNIEETIQTIEGMRVSFSELSSDVVRQGDLSTLLEQQVLLLLRQQVQEGMPINQEQSSSASITPDNAGQSVDDPTPSDIPDTANQTEVLQDSPLREEDLVASSLIEELRAKIVEVSARVEGIETVSAGVEGRLLEIDSRLTIMDGHRTVNQSFVVSTMKKNAELATAVEAHGHTLMEISDVVQKLTSSKDRRHSRRLANSAGGLESPIKSSEEVNEAESVDEEGGGVTSKGDLKEVSSNVTQELGSSNGSLAHEASMDKSKQSIQEGAGAALKDSMPRHQKIPPAEESSVTRVKAEHDYLTAFESKITDALRAIHQLHSRKILQWEEHVRVLQHQIEVLAASSQIKSFRGPPSISQLSFNSEIEPA
ncbi:hypothetical protein CEUSTIGMA_g121.t1 [Chlamydomonas eustigma]|uniref:Uncharacterized protein n=1 Tax=Chlamydomonas eustigma TaxID=1157962 RepID=A0A250WPA4_9CHLO|nr:hypothetical protein CEUSTIGMA_g121.t1 [Chlamydomonas eustigma]|eukprot:GAX72665.1 hypothetical protein CEUSTIGMA_g121.t1 [Chlamydomonas eustigma]